MTDTSDPARREPFSAVELSYLAFVYRVVEPGPCRVCGEPLTTRSIGSRSTTIYHCSAAAESVIHAGPPGSAEARAASEHWRASEVHVSFRCDPDVVRLVAEYRALLAAAGEELGVPVGAHHFPYGHGPGRCDVYFEHGGDDLWILRSDASYDHDPSHRTHPA
jgi:hypothetical protein